MSRRIAAALLGLPVAAALCFSAFWRRPSKAPQPGGLSPDEYDALARIAGLYFGVRKLPATVEGDDITVAGEGGPQRFPLTELAAACRGRPRSVWPDAVAAYFNGRLAGQAAPAAAAQPRSAHHGWMGPFDPIGYARFVAELLAYFRQRDVAVTMEDGYAVVAGAAGHYAYSVHELMVACFHAEPASWPEQIVARFRETQSGDPSGGPPPAGGAPVAGAIEGVPRLSLRLVAPRELEAVPLEQMIAREDLPGLKTLLVWDTGERVVPEDVAGWGVSVGELFAAGLANLRQRPAPESELVALGGREQPGAEGERAVGPVPAMVFRGEGDVAVRALLMGQQPRLLGRHGALVAVPAAQLFACCPVEGPEAVVTAQRLAGMAAAWRGEGAAALSPFLYWYHDGAFDDLPYVVDEHGEVLMSMPAELAALMQPAAQVSTPEAAPAVPHVSAGAAAGFAALVQGCFHRYGFQATVEPGGVYARDGAGHEVRMPYEGLDQVPAQVPRERWARWVEAFFEEPLRTLRGAQALMGRSFDDVRELLGVQLYDEATVREDVRRATVSTSDLPGLLSAVVCQLPQGTFRLPPHTLFAWGVSAQAVTAAARANLRRLRPPVERLFLAPGVEGVRLKADGGFAAAQAVTIAAEPEWVGPCGALVAVPRRGLLLVCPLVPMPRAAGAYVDAAKGLIGRILQSEWEGHMPLSRRLYWYRDGGFAELPYVGRIEEGTSVVEFTPPEALTAALAELGNA